MWMGSDEDGAFTGRFSTSAMHGAILAGGVELWAWIGAYDHVAVCQLWGDMTRLPRKIPRFTRELKQYWEMAGEPRLPRQDDGRHDALADARHNLVRYRAIANVRPSR